MVFYRRGFIQTRLLKGALKKRVYSDTIIEGCFIEESLFRLDYWMVFYRWGFIKTWLL